MPEPEEGTMAEKTEGPVRITLADPERYLLEEIADTRLKREDIALTYALAIWSGEEIDWLRVNKAIIERWSLSGLRWVKERAWKLIKEKGAPDA